MCMQWLYSCQADLLLRFWLSFKSLAVDAQNTFILVLEVGRRETGHWGRELLQRKILISSPSLCPNSLLVWFPHKVRSYFWPRLLILRISTFQQSGGWHSRKTILQNLLELDMRAKRELGGPWWRRGCASRSHLGTEVERERQLSCCTESGHLKEMAGPGTIKWNKSDMEGKPHLFSHMHNVGLILRFLFLLTCWRRSQWRKGNKRVGYM